MPDLKTANFDAIVRCAVESQIYAGLSRIACDEHAQGLCEAAIRTGCYRFLAGHLEALSRVGRWDLTYTLTHAQWAPFSFFPV